MTSGEMRVGDDERLEAVRLLEGQAAEGRLNPQELTDRREQALSAVTRGDVVDLFRDLPVDPPAAGAGQGFAPYRPTSEPEPQPQWPVLPSSRGQGAGSDDTWNPGTTETVSWTNLQPESHRGLSPGGVKLTLALAAVATAVALGIVLASAGGGWLALAIPAFLWIGLFPALRRRSSRQRPKPLEREE
ncbi:DUF1707 SHOCT-like domain-containing protein [Propionibacteriaceae bacterium Y2011]|uniref:DUF1707 SHOCT-like domain-containing protein n=1 Tax=Microlunatus sp. Y2014 TaxID=3418488 RepID=UPI003B44DE1A